MGGSMSSIVIFGDTSGSITLDAPAVAGTNTLTLPAATGTILTTASSINASSITSGTLPKQQLPAGSVLQVITATDLVERSTTSTSFVTASNTLSVTISPTSASNKIFVVATTTGYKNDNNNGIYTIYRGATNLGNPTNGMQVINFNQYVPVAMSILDSPNTTNSTTYQVYFRMSGGTGNAYLSAGIAGANNFSSMTVFEIAG
jgi:hypothetical protein